MSSKLTFSIEPVAMPIKGSLRVPGDKSISHRAVIFSSLANGVSNITGLLEGEDVLATLAAFRAMGVKTAGPKNGKLRITGTGLHGLSAPETDLDMGNSGTAMRLLSGILVAQQFASKLVGDDSLTTRPMRRVTVPLCSMGARCVSDENGCPPIHIRAVDKLEPIDYNLPMASAQVKSAVLLAGLYADGETSVTEPAPTRDHTERMLRVYGYPCETIKLDEQASCIKLNGGGELTATDIDIPADISSAAFFMVAASIIKGSNITLQHVGINPTRTGVIDVLRAMGAEVQFVKHRDVGGEPVADIKVKFVGLRGIDIDPKYVALAIDEIPILCIAAACAKGVTKITGAEELRHKECDRISAMVKGLRDLGIEVVENRDGMEITGGQFTGGEVDSYDDHRIAMAFTIAGAVALGTVSVAPCDNVATSFPNFLQLANELGLPIMGLSEDLSGDR
jgi:3-phosphoshikimate 1-carboxyvinyltransferase